MNQKRARVGVCGRNDHQFQEADFALVKSAKIESVKMMSFTDLAVFDRLVEDNAGIDFVVRLYDGRFGKGGRHPTPSEFANTFIPIIERLGTYADKFEIHNEPNHLHGIEGWGQEDHHAVDFNAWFLQVYDRLKQAHPWAWLGFPGLAIPHRDLEWIEICRPAVEKADWQGCHNYWQNPTSTEGNHLADFWGLRFKHYHDRFPNKPIEITEFGNSNGQSGFPVNPDKIAKEYVAYYQELFKYPYLRSASSFIMSAPQAEWKDFTWRRENGENNPVVGMVGAMPRPELWGEEAPAPPPDPDPPPESTDSSWKLLTLPSGYMVNLDFVIDAFPLLDGKLLLTVAHGLKVEEFGDRGIRVCDVSRKELSVADAEVFMSRWPGGQ